MAGVQASFWHRMYPRPSGQFQSLSRDGGGSSFSFYGGNTISAAWEGFNPSVGMAGVQASPLGGAGWVASVSIPQSGWRGFKRGVVGDSPGDNQFQSLSRDGGGSSLVGLPSAGSAPMFQSLSRDGGGSSLVAELQVVVSGMFQSLSRDGGGSSESQDRSIEVVVVFQSLSRDGGGSSCN